MITAAKSTSRSRQATGHAPAAITTPGHTALFIVAALAVLLVGTIVWPGFFWIAVAGDVALVIALFVEGRILARQPVTIRRRWARRAQIHRPLDLNVEVENRGRRTTIITLRQPWPADVDAERHCTQLTVKPNERITIALEITPRRRGQVQFPPLEVDAAFRHDLARRRWTINENQTLCVYPDLARLWTYDRLRRSRALGQQGVHRQRLIGTGRMFEQLREYLPDDDYRDINWKATARSGRPVTNLYQAERSRDVILCIDHSRMMGNPIGAGTALDCAVDAAALLARISSQQGDQVGLALFTDRINTRLKPARGTAAVHTIIEHLVSVAPQPCAANYAALVEALCAHQNHRSLIFLFTDLNDPQSAGNLTELMPLLARRHLVVTVNLRDPMLDQVADAPANNKRDVYRVLAAGTLVRERDQQQRILTRTGVQALDADAASLSLAVINRYMSIKSRQLL